MKQSGASQCGPKGKQTESFPAQDETGILNGLSDLMKKADGLPFFQLNSFRAMVEDLMATDRALDSLTKAGTELQKFGDQCFEYLKVAQDMADKGDICHEKLNKVKPSSEALEGIEKLFDDFSTHAPSLWEQMKSWIEALKHGLGFNDNSKPSKEELNKQIDDLMAATEKLRHTSTEVEKGLQAIRDRGATLSLKVSIFLLFYDTMCLGSAISHLTELDKEIPLVKEKRQNIEDELQAMMDDLQVESEKLDRALRSSTSIDQWDKLRMEKIICQKEKRLQNLISRCRDIVNELEGMQKTCNNTRSNSLYSIFSHSQQLVRHWFTGANAASILSRNSVIMMVLHGLFIGFNAVVMHNASSKLEEVCKELDACMLLQESIKNHRMQLQSFEKSAAPK